MAAFLPSPSPATSATVAAAAAAAAKSCGGHVTTASLLSLPLPPLRLARGGGGRASLGALAGRRGRTAVAAKAETGGGGGREGEEGEVERALGMDGGIPGSSGEFVRRVSSRAYGMRRHLMESLDSLAYDVLETNPWREDSKPVYVLARRDNHLWTMKTRRSRSEIEKELGMLFSKGRSGVGNKSKYSRSKFTMLVEDIREGVLVFEDEDDAVKYCDLLQGGGQGCEGIAELEASSVFNLCHKMKALAVLFRRGRTPPLPQSLEHDLRARKRSLED